MPDMTLNEKITLYNQLVTAAERQRVINQAVTKGLHCLWDMRSAINEIASHSHDDPDAWESTRAMTIEIVEFTRRISEFRRLTCKEGDPVDPLAI